MVPQSGKTTTSSFLAEATQLHRINVGDLVRDKNLHDGWDEHFYCHVINEDLVCDELEEMTEEGGNIVDYHGCDFFPGHWFDCVVVLQTNNSVLYDRLSKRGYTQQRIGLRIGDRNLVIHVLPLCYVFWNAKVTVEDGSFGMF